MGQAEENALSGFPRWAHPTRLLLPIVGLTELYILIILNQYLQRTDWCAIPVPWTIYSAGCTRVPHPLAFYVV